MYASQCGQHRCRCCRYTEAGLPGKQHRGVTMNIEYVVRRINAANVEYKVAREARAAAVDIVDAYASVDEKRDALVATIVSAAYEADDEAREAGHAYNRAHRRVIRVTEASEAADTATESTADARSLAHREVIEALRRFEHAGAARDAARMAATIWGTARAAVAIIAREAEQVGRIAAESE